MKKGIYTEIIDGVTVIHTGRYEKDKDNNVEREIIYVYDNKGNKLYCNCSSIEKAQDLVMFLSEKNINAVVGPKSPYIVNDSGEIVLNKNENDVGVYVIPTINKDLYFPNSYSQR